MKYEHKQKYIPRCNVAEFAGAVIDSLLSTENRGDILELINQIWEAAGFTPEDLKSYMEVYENENDCEKLDELNFLWKAWFPVSLFDIIDDNKKLSKRK